MQRDAFATAAYVLALVLAVGYAAAGIIGWIADVTDGDGSDLFFWLLFLLAGAALILIGLFRVPRWSWTSVILISAGALAGALPLVWSIVAPILAVVLIVLAVLVARRPAAAT
ncbi:MAG TPA: hypothetical protein VKB13_05595 [Gaiellaceae bacterium]|nr:hypothetical protein [Gaiellaceae bacterium]